MFKAMYRYHFVGIADSYEKAKQMLVDRFGSFDPNFAFIEMLG